MATAGVGADFSSSTQSQVNFIVFLKSLFSVLSSASTDVTFPSFLLTFLIMRLPQLMNVAFSPSFNCSASTPSMSTSGPVQTVFSPTSGFLGWNGDLCDASTAPPTMTGTLYVLSTVVCLGTTGSITFLLKAQILSHSIKTTDLLLPCAMMNCFKASTVRPRFSTPLTVGRRGSSQPSTTPSSTR